MQDRRDPLQCAGINSHKMFVFVFDSISCFFTVTCDKIKTKLL